MSRSSGHIRIDFQDDYDSVKSRSTGISARGVPLPRPRVEQRGYTRLNPHTAWAMARDDPEYALDKDGGLYNEALDSDVFGSDPAVKRKKKKKRSAASIRPSVFWQAEYSSSYLDEMIWHDGRGDFRHVESLGDCPDCGGGKKRKRQEDVNGMNAMYRCTVCVLGELTCGWCMQRRHSRMPFHRIEKWNGSFFEKSCLKDLGQTIQLNHSGSRCPNPVAAHEKFLVLDTTGVHHVRIHYCGCSRQRPNYQQLMRRGLFPSTPLVPRTAATFPLLRLLHLLSLTSKATVYDFYRALERMTDNTSIAPPKNRYKALMRMLNQWRQVKRLKRGGRGHSIDGVKATGQGELSVKCPSCPWDGINLPVGWKDAPEGDKFLYSLVVSMDANFRLKQQLVSSYSKDPLYGDGWAYFVPKPAFDKFVLSCTSDDDISTCVGFAALAKASTKFSKGLRYTGVGAISCAVSEMWLANGVGNLQKGERYSNMDYIAGSGLRAYYGIRHIIFGYDVSCQFFKNLRTRMENWPPDIQPSLETEMDPGVGKFHEPGHMEKGHHEFSFNLIKGAGQVDGENQERQWAAHNALGGSTKAMGPGTRALTLEDNFGFWNWMKYSSHGDILMRKYKRAIADRNIQVEAHRGLTEATGKEVTDEWEAMCVLWEKTPYPKYKTVEDPYEVKNTAMTVSQVQKELALSETRRRNEGGSIVHATSPSAFLVTGLEIEETQRKLRLTVSRTGSSITARQEAGLSEQRSVLRARLRTWEALRIVYMPGLPQYWLDIREAPNPEVEPEDLKLWLPSSLPQNLRIAICHEGLPEMELKLREAQLADHLNTVRHTLRLKTRMVQFKNKNVRGQRSSIRSRAIIDSIHERAKSAAVRYRTAREARLALEGSGEWCNVYRELKNEDVRSYQDPARAKPWGGRRGTEEDGVEVSNIHKDDDDINLFPGQRDATYAVTLIY